MPDTGQSSGPIELPEMPLPPDLPPDEQGDALTAERERIASAAEEMADDLEWGIFLQEAATARHDVQMLFHQLAAIARGDADA